MIEWGYMDRFERDNNVGRGHEVAGGMPEFVPQGTPEVVGDVVENTTETKTEVAAPSMVVPTNNEEPVVENTIIEVADSEGRFAKKSLMSIEKVAKEEDLHKRMGGLQRYRSSYLKQERGVSVARRKA